MGLKYASNCSVVGFIDCMFGFISFIYLNIQEYRHKPLGSQEEVILSYVLGIYGFLKGLALSIPAAQLVAENGRAALGRWACIIWLVLSIPQLGLTIALMYNFWWPFGSHMMVDIFLFVVRSVYVIFLVGAFVYVFLLWLELEPYAPPKPERQPKPRRNVKKNATGASHQVDAANGNQQESDTESGA